jgi:hypothetical protein
MEHAAWIFLTLVFGLAATSHGQDLNNLHRVFKTNPNPKLQQKLETLHQKLGEVTGVGFGAPDTDGERI